MNRYVPTAPNVMNAVSISFLIAPVSSAVMAIWDPWYAWLILWMLLLGFVTERLKDGILALTGDDWARRPVGAFGCDMFCRGGNVAGHPGFPSGHMTIVTFFLVSVWYHARARWILWIGPAWLGAMAWARWAKRCHTAGQIIGGVVWGSVVAYGAHVIGV